MTELGVKKDQGKPRASLLPGMRAMLPIIRVLQWAIEVKGYPEGSWRHVEPQRYRDAFSRHVLAWIDDPLSRDEESGYSHLAHAGCCLLFLLWFNNQGDPS